MHGACQFLIWCAIVLIYIKIKICIAMATRHDAFNSTMMSALAVQALSRFGSEFVYLHQKRAALY
ncbi:MAG: hypothetical protein CMK70_06175 [Pseudohongiella sp.]|nr:hypothetical protein [Pseudohongiella sp.]MAO39807.1 hypothetical protein [Pseudohongiella sp.]